MSKDFSILSLCIYMQVSRSGYYAWIKRKGSLNRYECDRETLKHLVMEYWKRHRTNGYRNIAKQIRLNTGWIFSNWLYHKVCKQLNIRSRARLPKYAHPGEEHILFPNRISGEWTTTRPFEKVVTDTTLIKNRHQKIDLTFYLDVFNLEIISWDAVPTRSGMDTASHMRALKGFLSEKTKRGYKGVETILHSDQGPVYTSSAFNNAHSHYNIKRSMSRVGTPTDNPVIEAINGWIKDDLRIDFDIRNSKDPIKTIEEYIWYFNNVRFAHRLKYKAPIQARLELGLT
ncbi:MAG: IS3 family transposase [Candidatus Izemoplasmatales bacterium]|nr:IS3 family transposase [Candidatus Izemoplasmatales bacterium]